MTQQLLGAIRAAAVDLPAALGESLARAVENEEAPTAAARGRAANKNPGPNYRHHVVALFDAWASRPDLSGPGVSLAMRSALDAVMELRDLQEVEIVWTGPATGLLVARSTREVLIEVIRAAQRSLICLSFAAYKADVVQSELVAAAERGVDVMLILETEADSKGGLSRDARAAFEVLEGVASFFLWPGENRPSVGSGTARFHAKAVVADRSVAFVSSANLTGAAIDSNVELGLVVRGGPVPEQLETQIRELIANGVLRRVT